jgi:hypothetical protein
VLPLLLLLLLCVSAVQISPHILIHWRPDAGNFKAFLVKQAPKGARVTPGVNMTVLPSIADQVGWWIDNNNLTRKTGITVILGVQRIIGVTPGVNMTVLPSIAGQVE